MEIGNLGAKPDIPVTVTRGTPIREIRLDDYDDAESHAYALAAKLNEIIERINAMNEVTL